MTRRKLIPPLAFNCRPRLRRASLLTSFYASRICLYVGHSVVIETLKVLRKPFSSRTIRFLFLSEMSTSSSSFSFPVSVSQHPPSLRSISSSAARSPFPGSFAKKNSTNQPVTLPRARHSSQNLIESVSRVTKSALFLTLSSYFPASQSPWGRAINPFNTASLITPLSLSLLLYCLFSGKGRGNAAILRGRKGSLSFFMYSLSLWFQPKNLKK